jgi:hypothetical protein
METHLGRAGLSAALLLYAMPALAETRGYVVSWFATATYSQDFKNNCPQNKNAGRYGNSVKALMTIGYSEEEAIKIMSTQDANLGPEYMQRIESRARVNGKPASIYNYPEAVPDPNIELSSGRYAYGFDLGSKNVAAKFEDPETHQKIDNQLWRAVGCTESFRAVPPDIPYFEDLTWHLMIDSAPAWAFQITGDDLSKDGKVTVVFDKTVQHLMRDASGNVMTNATYVIDPSPRSHNVFQGEIKDGVLTIDSGNLYLEGELPYYTEISLTDTHMRIKQQGDGRLVGYWGGYTDWKKFVYMYTARGGINGEDVVGMYHALKKLADYGPDPKTGQNQLISTAFRMEATTVYLATTEGKIVAHPAPPPSGGIQKTAENPGSTASK